MFGIDNIPGYLTFLGGTVSLIGIFVITKGGFELEIKQQKEEIELNS